MSQPAHLAMRSTISAMRKAAKFLIRHEPHPFRFVCRGHYYLGGWCYCFAEALHWLHPELKLKLRKLLSEDLPADAIWLSHYYLVTPEGVVVDPTVKQFSADLDYTKGKPRSFRARKPSKRTKRFIEVIKLYLVSK